MRFQVMVFDTLARTWVEYMSTTTSPEDARRIVGYAQADARGNRKVYLVVGDTYEDVARKSAAVREGKPWRITSALNEAGIIEPVSGIEAARRFFEDGQGGDRDAPYLRWLPMQANTLTAWARLMGRVQRGEVGGPNDGGE